mmetsp:Transcript_83149/g.222201  ORF Transcript_83149/g.222201 Transcript_83149/m.222201 type:complete len:357 (-) Transcript_83149:92-1162(-)
MHQLALGDQAVQPGGPAEKIRGGREEVGGGCCDPLGLGLIPPLPPGIHHLPLLIQQFLGLSVLRPGDLQLLHQRVVLQLNLRDLAAQLLAVRLQLLLHGHGLLHLPHGRRDAPVVEGAVQQRQEAAVMHAPGHLPGGLVAPVEGDPVQPEPLGQLFLRHALNAATNLQASGLEAVRSVSSDPQLLHEILILFEHQPLPLGLDEIRPALEEDFDRTALDNLTKGSLNGLAVTFFDVDGGVKVSAHRQHSIPKHRHSIRQLPQQIQRHTHHHRIRRLQLRSQHGQLLDFAVEIDGRALVPVEIRGITEQPVELLPVLEGHGGDQGALIGVQQLGEADVVEGAGSAAHSWARAVRLLLA